MKIKEPSSKELTIKKWVGTDKYRDAYDKIFRKEAQDEDITTDTDDDKLWESRVDRACSPSRGDS